MFAVLRRDFLKGLLPAAALLGGCRPPGVARCTASPAQLLGWLQPFADRKLGQAALAQGLGNTGAMAPLGQLCEGDFVPAFRRQLAADFAAGRTVVLDGWVLSETEAFTHRAVYLSGVQPGAGPGP